MKKKPVKTKELQAYEYYLKLGTNRSLKKVAEHFKLSSRTIERWASKLKWTDQIEKHIAGESKNYRQEKIHSEANRQEAPPEPEIINPLEEPERGRPTILSFELIKDFYEVISLGVYVKQACNYLGVNVRYYYQWMAHGEKDEEQGKETIYAHFYLAMKKALDIAEVNAINEIQKATKNTWQAAAWYLERRAPDRWGRRDSIQYTGQIIENEKISKKIEDLLDDPDTIQKANEILTILSNDDEPKEE